MVISMSCLSYHSFLLSGILETDPGYYFEYACTEKWYANSLVCMYVWRRHDSTVFPLLSLLYMKRNRWGKRVPSPLQVKRVQPIKREALSSAQLLRRRQREAISSMNLNGCYGHQADVDTLKGILKRDIFMQGLLLKWQE